MDDRLWVEVNEAFSNADNIPCQRLGYGAAGQHVLYVDRAESTSWMITAQTYVVH